MNIQTLLDRCRTLLRLLDNYYVPENIRLDRIRQFLQEVIIFEFEHCDLLKKEEESIFTLLCEDIITKARAFISSSEKNINDAKNILQLILSTETYLFDLDRLPWRIGRSLSFFEKVNLRRIFLKRLHNAFDPKTKRPIRGTRLFVALCGSLAQGFSDWKLINGGDIPKPSDCEIPREYRKTSSALYKRLDEELMLPQKLKPLMADVDILIMNEVIFDSCDPGLKHTPWSFKLGEKYRTGLAGSPILNDLHQALLQTKIAGIRGRWISFIAVKDEQGYENYMRNRTVEIKKLEERVHKKIEIHDILIVDQIIH